MAIVKLLDAVDVDTNGAGVQGDGAERLCHIYAVAFGSGTVTLQMSTDGGTTWTGINQADGTAAAFTVATVVVVSLIPAATLIRAILTGSSGASDVTAELA